MNEQATVTITQAEYCELVKSKFLASSLLAMIRRKKEAFSTLTHADLELLDSLFGVDSEPLTPIIPERKENS